MSMLWISVAVPKPHKVTHREIHWLLEWDLWAIAISNASNISIFLHHTNKYNEQSSLFHASKRFWFPNWWMAIITSGWIIIIIIIIAQCLLRAHHTRFVYRENNKSEVYQYWPRCLSFVIKNSPKPLDITSKWSVCIERSKRSSDRNLCANKHFYAPMITVIPEMTTDFC